MPALFLGQIWTTLPFWRIGLAVALWGCLLLDALEGDEGEESISIWAENICTKCFCIFHEIEKRKQNFSKEKLYGCLYRNPNYEMSEYHSFQVSKAVPILEPQWPDLMRFIILLLFVTKASFQGYWWFQFWEWREGKAGGLGKGVWKDDGGEGEGLGWHHHRISGKT